MKRPEWTQGPWQWVTIDGVGYLRSAAAIAKSGDIDFNNGDPILDDGSAGGEYGVSIDINGPDACLIAAAPDLYQALEAILSVMKPGIDGHDDLLHVWLNHPDKPERTPGSMARAALAKARGEQPA